MRVISVHLLTYVCIASCFSIASPAVAQDAVVRWKIDKMSGQVWVVTSGAQNVALTSDTQLSDGDSIRTAGNGRVMLRRGEETILISPNSVVGLPAEAKAGSTKIIHQAGSIQLEVNKRDVRNFAVETPYLVAAVKGTQFTVTVGAKGANVNVRHGSVEVADNKSGKFALVLPGQSAAVSAFGNGGLTLRGLGALSPIQNGAPNVSPVGRVPVPRGGLTSPMTTRASLGSPTAPSVPGSSAGALRISAPIGQVRLDVQTATRGLARESGASTAGRSSQTIWNGGETRTTSASQASNGNNSGGPDGSGNNGRGNSNGNVAAAANNISSGNNGVDNSGNGNNGKGKGRGNSSIEDNSHENSGKGKGNNNGGSKGNGKGNSASGNANAGGNGNSGNANNGNGNSGNGNNGNGSGIGKALGKNGNGNSNSNGNNGNGNNGNGNGGGNGNSGNGNIGNANNGNGNSGNGNGNGNGGVIGKALGNNGNGDGNDGNGRGR